jgi:hypothetical protein
MFVLCGAAMVAEVHFKRATGRFVKGIPGKIWCLFIFSIYGKLMVDSWFVFSLTPITSIEKKKKNDRKTLIPVSLFTSNQKKK